MNLDDVHARGLTERELVIAVPEVVVAGHRLLVGPVPDSSVRPTPVALRPVAPGIAPSDLDTHVVEAPIVAVIHEDEISLQERIVLLRWGHTDEIGSDRAARMASALLIAHEEEVEVGNPDPTIAVDDAAYQRGRPRAPRVARVVGSFPPCSSHGGRPREPLRPRR